MLSNKRGTLFFINNEIDNLLYTHLSDRLTKPIDLSMMAVEQTPSSPSLSSISLSSISSIQHSPATAPVNFLQIKNMIELTVENARLREKQLENEIGKEKKKR